MTLKRVRALSSPPPAGRVRTRARNQAGGVGQPDRGRERHTITNAPGGGDHEDQQANPA